MVLYVFYNSYALISFDLKLTVLKIWSFWGLSLGWGPKDTNEYMRWLETEQTTMETTKNKRKSKEASEKKFIWGGAKKDMWMLWNKPHFTML